MSKKLQRAVQSGTVVARNKTAGEVGIIYMRPDGSRGVERLAPFASVEICPRLTKAEFLKHGNIQEMIGNGWIAIQ